MHDHRSADTALASDLDVAAGLIELARNARNLGHTSPRGVRSVLADVASRLEGLAGDLTRPR